MGIIKRDSVGYVKKANYNSLDILSEEKVESVRISKEEYASFLEEGKKAGYEEGMKLGYEDGFVKGKSVLEEERELFLKECSDEKENIAKFLEIESMSYINSFKGDIKNIVFNVINNVFMGAVSQEYVMEQYFDYLILYLVESYKKFRITVNEYTYNAKKSILEDNNISFEIDNSIDNYDLIVSTESESLEYFKKETYKKISDMFS